jgi:hypothetical protein
MKAIFGSPAGCAMDSNRVRPLALTLEQDASLHCFIHAGIDGPIIFGGRAMDYESLAELPVAGQP